MAGQAQRRCGKGGRDHGADHPAQERERDQVPSAGQVDRGAQHDAQAAGAQQDVHDIAERQPNGLPGRRRPLGPRQRHSDEPGQHAGGPTPPLAPQQGGDHHRIGRPDRRHIVEPERERQAGQGQQEGRAGDRSQGERFPAPRGRFLRFHHSAQQATPFRLRSGHHVGMIYR